jgi:hypothetical protein
MLETVKVERKKKAQPTRSRASQGKKQPAHDRLLVTSATSPVSRDSSSKRSVARSSPCLFQKATPASAPVIETPLECEPPDTEPVVLDDPAEELRVLVDQANRGEKQALSRLRWVLDRHPEIWQTLGDLGKVAEAAWTELLVKDDVLSRESVRRYLSQLKAELIDTQPTPLGKLLVDEIGVCYLVMQHAEITAASPSTGSLAQAAFRLKRAESAQRRFLAALKTMAALRALFPAGLSSVTSRPAVGVEAE